MSDLGKYAIGQQSFEMLRNDGAVYVDKTMYAARIVNSPGNYYFLARPRRFGKSLFLSMLQCLYEGKRHLFTGLYIDSTDWPWEKYPVLHLDLNSETYKGLSGLDQLLTDRFEEWERQFGLQAVAADFPIRFKNIIEGAHAATGKPVVILVDEYDKPLVHNLSDTGRFEHYRNQLAGLYSNFKSCADHIRLVFMTGVSRFSKLSVFSDLNNIRDISFSDEYADICGITGDEMLHNYPDSIRALADAHMQLPDESIAVLKANYDGYRFARRGSEIYNPWSLLNAFSNLEIGNYWNDTALPTILVESLKKMDTDLSQFLHSTCSVNALRGLDLLNPLPLPLLYQTGYLTIKDYSPKYQEYTLGVPNREVAEGLYDILLPHYADIKSQMPETYIQQFRIHLRRGQPDAFMKELSNFFASIDYSMKMENENNFHNDFYIFTRLLGLKTDTEVRTSAGRIDLTITTDEFVYLIELKYDSTPAEALRQIDDKQYALKFAGDSRRLFKIGADFNSKSRLITSYVIES